MTADYSTDQNLPAGIETAVINSLAQMLKQDPAGITASTRFFEDLQFDSTSVLELLMELEIDLGVEFDVETLEPADFDTVGALVSYVARQSEAVG